MLLTWPIQLSCKQRTNLALSAAGLAKPIKVMRFELTACLYAEDEMSRRQARYLVVRSVEIATDLVKFEDGRVLMINPTLVGLGWQSVNVSLVKFVT